MWVLLIGTVMIAVTVAIHAIGATLWLRFAARRFGRERVVLRLPALLAALIGTSTVLLLLHVAEAMLWAGVYYLLPGHAGLAGFRDAVYFSMVTFTTLGYGDLVLATHWRALAGMEAMVGIAAFGLTTALLVAVIHRYWVVVHGE